MEGYGVNTTAKITSKGQVTIPCVVRDALGLEKGDSLLFEIRHDDVVIRKPRDLMDFVGFLGDVVLPDDEEALLSPEVCRKMLERE